MQKLLFVAALFISMFAATQLYADDVKRPSANIAGHVVDLKSGEHLPYIRILLKGTTVGTVTDASGHYQLRNVPVGKYTLEASSVGYKTVSRVLTIKKNASLDENFEMEEDYVSLDGVVVTADRAETSRRMAPTLVNVLDAKLFEKTSSSTLSQTLNFQPGVRLENNCQNCGFSQVRINGLDGPYTQILVDSRPVFGALAGVYGLEQIPTNMIDRVEVMRGGGSALFGASAIAGTINIITKEPLRNSGSVAHTFTGFNSKNKAFDNNTTMNVSIVSDNRKAGLYVYGANRHRDGVDLDGDKYTELPTLEDQSIGVGSYLKLSNFSKITVGYHHLQEYRRGGDQLNRPPHEVQIAEQIQHSINSGNVKYDYSSPNTLHHLSLYASAQQIARKSYYGGIGGETSPEAIADARRNYGRTNDATWVVGGQYIYHMNNCLFMPADLTLGAEYNYDDLKDEMSGRDRFVNQRAKIASALFQNEWKNDRWALLLGGRFDKHNLIDHVIFSPRANVRFNPTKDINLRASYAFGFRAPQIFDEDLHVESLGGDIVRVLNAKNLTEEKSQSFSLSADMYHHWGPWQANLLIEGFYTRLSGAFGTTKIAEQEDGVIIKERRNQDDANVYGGIIEGKIAYLNYLQFQAGITVQRAAYTNPVEWSEGDDTHPAQSEKRILRTPNTYGYFTLTATPVKPWAMTLAGVYTGNMLVPHMAGSGVENDVAVSTPKFFEIDFKTSYDFRIFNDVTLQLNGGVKNIFNSFQSDFDKGAKRDSGYIYGPSMPRAFYAGVKLSF